MTQYIDKSTLVAEIKRRIKECDKLASAAADNNLSNTQQANELLIRQYTNLLHFLDSIEVKEIHEDIDVDLNPIFEEFGVEPDSRIASMFKEAFYKGVDRYLNKKDNKL